MFKNCRRVGLCNVPASPTETLVATLAKITCHHRSVAQYIDNLDERTYTWTRLQSMTLSLIFLTKINNALLIKFLIPDANF